MRRIIDLDSGAADSSTLIDAAEVAAYKHLKGRRLRGKPLKQTIMRTRKVAGAIATFLAAVAFPAQATFHLMRVVEVFPGTAAAPKVMR